MACDTNVNIKKIDNATYLFVMALQKIVPKKIEKIKNMINAFTFVYKKNASNEIQEKKIQNVQLNLIINRISISTS